MPRDALNGECSVAQVGTLKPLRTFTEGGARWDVAEARSYAPRAMRALLRIAEAGEGRAAVEAAREILTRAFGPASFVPTPDVQTSLSTPDWLTGNRLTYRSDRQDGVPPGGTDAQRADDQLTYEEGRGGRRSDLTKACLRQGHPQGGGLNLYADSPQK
jgi:hypothetical protein